MLDDDLLKIGMLKNVVLKDKILRVELTLNVAKGPSERS